MSGGTERTERTEREIINIEEAARLLGVSVKTFNKVLHSQCLPARKIGREWKFSRQALIDWVGSGRSDQFYREQGAEGSPEAGSENGPEVRPEVRNGVVQAAAPRKDARRTSGWRLELD